MKKTGISLMISSILGFGLSGCYTNPSMSVEVTSHHTGCETKDIQISDEVMELNDDHTWTAKCKGKTYRCSDHDSAGSECLELPE
jgi:hypothetical protein